MNSLSVNLHLMMVSFYRPTPQRFKILIENGTFPSDRYAVASQALFHGFDPNTAIVELMPRPGEMILRTEDILRTIEKEGPSIALVLLGSVNYLTGQAFDIQAITAAARARGCCIGFDLAHGAGNLKLNLHDWGPDFAVWCSYKYLNGGPGTVSGCFVHERHSQNRGLPRFAGWWGHNKTIRFKMTSDFDPIPGAEGWQLSNPPIFQLAALRASMEIFDKVTMSAIEMKSKKLTAYMEYMLEQLLPDHCQIVTPRDPKERGAQLSLRLKGQPKDVQQDLGSHGVIVDFREPDVVRAAPTALYNRYHDVFCFVKTLQEILKKNDTRKL